MSRSKLVAGVAWATLAGCGYGMAHTDPPNFALWLLAMMSFAVIVAVWTKTHTQ